MVNMTLLEGVWLADSRISITVLALWASVGVLAHLPTLIALNLANVPLHRHTLVALVITPSITITITITFDIAIVTLVPIVIMMAIMVVAIPSMMIMSITSMMIMPITSITMI